MKFERLYKQLFIAEQDKVEQKKEIAYPGDFNDVEPMPAGQPQEQNVQQQTTISTTLQDHVDKINAFIEFLNGTKTESLQTALGKLDVHSTPFEGISDNAQIKSSILATVKSAHDIVAVFNQYINTAKS